MRCWRPGDYRLVRARRCARRANEQTPVPVGHGNGPVSAAAAGARPEALNRWVFPRPSIASAHRDCLSLRRHYALRRSLRFHGPKNLSNPGIRRHVGEPAQNAWAVIAAGTMMVDDENGPEQRGLEGRDPAAIHRKTRPCRSSSTCNGRGRRSIRDLAHGHEWRHHHGHERPPTPIMP